MLIIRPTLSLAKRLKVKPEPSEAKSTTRLGDWYAVDLVLNRRQFILAVSSESRLGVVVGAAPYSSFPTRLPIAIAKVLGEIGVTGPNIESEVKQMYDVQLKKTLDRSIVGTMTDYCKHLQFIAPEGRLDLDDPVSLSLWISSTPSLLMEAVFPKDAALKQFGQLPPAKSAAGQAKGSLYLVK